MEVVKAEVNVGGFCFNAGIFDFEGGLEKPSAATIMRGLLAKRVSGSLPSSGAMRASHGGEGTIGDDEETIEDGRRCQTRESVAVLPKFLCIDRSSQRQPWPTTIFQRR